MVRPDAAQALLDMTRDLAEPLVVRAAPVKRSRKTGGGRKKRVPGGPPRAADGQTKARGWVLTVHLQDFENFDIGRSKFRDCYNKHDSTLHHPERQQYTGYEARTSQSALVWSF